MTCLACWKERRESLCPHSQEERSFRATYCLCELFYALKLGYVVTSYEECLLYVKHAPIFASFFKLCASMKYRHDKIPQEYTECPDIFCQEMNSASGFDDVLDRLTPELLETNLSEKTSIKHKMNRVIGM